MSARMLQGNGPPSFCYHCGKQLQRAKGKGLGLFYFNHVQIKGNDKPSRVHGFPCTGFAIENGATFVAGAKP